MENPKAKPLLWLDGSDEKSIRKQCKKISDAIHGVKVVTAQSRKYLRIRGEGSAGVDIDENHRAKGDIVELRFNFRLDTSGKVVLCTAGDADHAVRVTTSKNQVRVVSDKGSVSLGAVKRQGWNQLYLLTGKNRTRVQINQNPSGEIEHDAGDTWLFLGQGYLQEAISAQDCFLIDVGSVRTRVVRSD
jgi:hypothetical protein